MATTDLQKIIVEKVDDVNRLQDAWIAVLRPFLKPSVAAKKLVWTNIGGPGAPAFQNSWVNLNGGILSDANHRSVGFAKDSLGWVHLRGAAASGTVSTIMFQLPVGFRPLFSMVFPTDSNNVYQNVIIRPGGNVQQGSSGTPSNATQVLDGISFFAEN